MFSKSAIGNIYKWRICICFHRFCAFLKRMVDIFLSAWSCYFSGQGGLLLLLLLHDSSYDFCVGLIDGCRVY